jgi:hypothetical protein
MIVTQPEECVLQSDRPEAYVKAVRDVVSRSNVQLVVTIMPSKRTDR